MLPGAAVLCPSYPDPENEERDMLVPPPARITRRTVRDWLRVADSYTLWAFNAGRPTDR